MLSNRATLALDSPIHVFIYRVRPRLELANASRARHCVVLSLGGARDDAEKIAINGVHQSGWHILRTDTAAVLDAAQITGEHDTAMLDDLSRFGWAIEVL
jgi:hypothetical protein